MFFSRAILTLTLLFLLLEQSAFARNLQAVFSRRTGEGLEEKDIQEIIRANKLTWGNGQNILLIIDDLELISEEEFEDAFGISKSTFLNSWRIKFFSGRALSPLQVKTHLKGLTYVDENANALFLTFQSVSKDYAPKEIIIKSY